MASGLVPATKWLEVARRLSLGQSQAQISRDLMVNANSLNQTVNSENFAPYLVNAIRTRDSEVYDVSNHFSQELPAACKQITDTLNDLEASSTLRYHAARDTIRFSGEAPSTIKNVSVTDNSKHVTFEAMIQKTQSDLGTNPDLVQPTDIQEQINSGKSLIAIYAGGNAELEDLESLPGPGQDDDPEDPET